MARVHVDLKGDLGRVAEVLTHLLAGMPESPELEIGSLVVSPSISPMLGSKEAGKLAFQGRKSPCVNAVQVRV